MKNELKFGLILYDTRPFNAEYMSSVLKSCTLSNMLCENDQNPIQSNY